MGCCSLESTRAPQRTEGAAQTRGLARRGHPLLVGTTLRSRVNQRSYEIGELRTPSLRQNGQTRGRQIDCLRDLGAALGNESDDLWTMRNGYALCTERALATIAQRLNALDTHGIDALRDAIRIGIHSGVQVTDVEDAHLVSQAFCSALPVSYSNIPSERWKSFAVLVLEGTYEATLWAAVINARNSGSNVLFLTRLGGGAFGNEPQWIHDAMRRALTKVVDVSLDVRVVSYGKPAPALERLVAEFA